MNHRFLSDPVKARLLLPSDASDSITLWRCAVCGIETLGAAKPRRRQLRKDGYGLTCEEEIAAAVLSS